MEYAQAVDRGRFLLKRSESDQWELAELTYRVLVVERKATIVEWAEDLGVSRAYAANLRNAWDRYGGQRADTRSNKTFNECLTLAGVSEERARRIQEHADETGESVTTVHRKGKDRERRLARTREDLRDDDWRRELLKDRETRRLLRRELGLDREDEKPRERPSPVQEELEDLAQRLEALVGELKHTQVTPSERRNLARPMRRVLKSLEWLRAFVERDRKPGERRTPPPSEVTPQVVVIPDTPRDLVEKSPPPSDPPEERPRKRRTRERRRSPIEHSRV